MIAVLRICFLTAIVALLASCSSSTSNGTPDGYYVTAKLGSEDFSALESTCIGSSNGGVLVFAGTAGTTSPRQLNISVPNAEEGKSYTVATNMGMTMVCTVGTTATSIYTASLVSGNGELTITKLTATEASGTFSFSGMNTSGGSMTVSNGKFHVKLSK